MGKFLLIFGFLALYCYVAYSADMVVNGKVGRVIAPDKVISDTAFYTPSKIGIDDKIMRGRAVVDAHRKMKQDSYTSGVVYSHPDRVVSNYTNLMTMREKLKSLGFVAEDGAGSEWALIQQSQGADKKAGLPEKEWWK